MDTTEIRSRLSDRLGKHLDQFVRSPRFQFAVKPHEARAVLDEPIPASCEPLRAKLAANPQATHCLFSLRQLEDLLNYDPTPADSLRASDVPGLGETELDDQTHA